MAWKWTKRFLGTIALLALSGMLYQTISTKIDERRYPPTGKMVDIGGYSLHLDDRGNKGPTVVLESGLGCSSLDWALVQPELAEFTRVCSYDRAGYGWSDESPNERTSENMVTELHTLLHNAKIPGPYILVGHSLGGVNARLYASYYPDEVSGVILVDSAHEDQFDIMPEIAKDQPSEALTLWMSRLGLMRLLSHTAQYKTSMEKVIGKLPTDIKQIRAAHVQTTKMIHTAFNETSALQKSLSELKSTGGLLGDKPLIVITAGTPLPSEGSSISEDEMTSFHQAFRGLQKDLVNKSTRGRQMIAENSDHMIPFHQPEIIVKAVRELVEEVQSSDQKVIQGDWSGTLDVSSMKFTVTLQIQQDENREITALFGVPGQGLTDIPVDTITFKNRLLQIEINKLQAQYEGTIDLNGKQITGTFTQNGTSLPLTFETGIHLKKRPQEPQPPFSYDAEEVSYDNTAAEITLSGTLTLPRDPGPFPVVVLITGSGAHDRDETIFGHKPFFVLADHLTRQGIAVLRVDDRGVGKSTGTFESATSADLATDVMASVKYLKTRKDIDSERIGLIGHSEGGLIAPMIAAQSKDIAFIVLMAGPGVSGEEILYEQGALIQRDNSVPEETISLYRELQEKMFAVVKAEPNQEIAENQLHDVIEKHYSELSEEQKDQIQTDQTQMDNQIKMVNSPWFRYFLTHEPATVLRKVTVPVLALNGELDLQVTSTQNLPPIAEALKQAGNEDYEVITLPRLNHLFQTSETGSITEYGEIEETISPTALNLISEWILERTGSTKTIHEI
jgi:uncharacterized protein